MSGCFVKTLKPEAANNRDHTHLRALQPGDNPSKIFGTAHVNRFDILEPQAAQKQLLMRGCHGDQVQATLIKPMRLTSRKYTYPDFCSDSTLKQTLNAITPVKD